MIARRNARSATLPPDQDIDLRDALEALAKPAEHRYGCWRMFATDDEALRAVVVEVGQVILARRVRVSVRDTERVLELTISNRHLIDISGLSVSPEEATAQQIVSALRQAMTDARALKFEIIDTAPLIRNGTRSWPQTALFQALQQGVDVATNSADWTDLVAQLKALSESWIDMPESAQPAAYGDAPAVEVLRQFAAARATAQGAGERIGRPQPFLAMVHTETGGLLIQLSLPMQQIYLAAPATHRKQITALWRAFVAVTDPGSTRPVEAG
ncbi:hypothetical protein J7413_11765 [Shimia sp. R10_1]|uniref:hypothetical protein n=1 Tax=Shimia sp. R10_1 TaxID=2821095 RepID=UPI001ADC0C76|nr:hypothetical protein [Shimia sp. R10_1]MBO9474217.1 hypothetical protein [Shimia sp. R10_1]